MKTRKICAIILMLAVLMTICITGCSGTSSENEENKGNETEATVSDNAVSEADDSDTSVEAAAQDNTNILASQIGTKLMNGYDKESIVTITFLDSLDTMPDDAWDISEYQDTQYQSGATYEVQPGQWDDIHTSCTFICEWELETTQETEGTQDTETTQDAETTQETESTQ